MKRTKTSFSTKELKESDEDCLKNFYEHRIKSLQSLKLDDFLKIKSLCPSCLLETEKATELVELLLNQYLDSSYETTLAGDSDYPLKLIRSIKEGHPRHNLEYNRLWAAAVNKFTKEFIEKYCLEDGRIDWDKLVRLSSESKGARDQK